LTATALEWWTAVERQEAGGIYRTGYPAFTAETDTILNRTNHMTIGKEKGMDSLPATHADK